jgi:hypothetical protein
MASLMLGIVACGGEEGEEEPAEEETEEAASQAVRPGQANPEFAQYCDKIFAIETFPEPEVDFEALTPAQQAEESKKFAAQLAPLAEEVRAIAPAQIRNDINLLADAVKRVQETGDFEAAFNTPEVNQASDRAHVFDLENCGWGRVDVTAVNYLFQNVPRTVVAGRTSFELINEGTEPHEFVLFRINDDVDEPIEELLENEEEAEDKVKFVTAAFADPGNEEYGVANLEAGRYAAVCFIPVGSVPEGQGQQASPGATPSPGSTTTTTTSTTTTTRAVSPGPTPTGTASPGGPGEEGPPHFTRGMVAEFTVS